MMLSHEIDGLGFALSCDLLKELGYANFPKPDVHLRDIFTALGLFEDAGDDYQLFKAIVRVAQHAGVTPYNADKAFWLIGSGKLLRRRRNRIKRSYPKPKTGLYRVCTDKVGGSGKREVGGKRRIHEDRQIDARNRG